jgi:anti-sigma factor RsiW
MDCNDARPLIDVDLDGELDLVRHLKLAAHLAACPACARYAEQARARHAALREALPRFTAPAPLAASIRSALQAEGAGHAEKSAAADPAPSHAPAPATASSVRRAPARGLLWQFTGLAASLAFAVFLGFAWGETRARKNLLLDEAVNDHVRSLQAGHLVDVVSSDQHTVKPWFAGKLDFAPPVTDLATAGFPLAGGRLEHLDGRPAAALVFHRRSHAINLFIWPAATVLPNSHQPDRNGYNTETWSRDGLNFLAVSEIPAAELAQFAAAFRDVQP